MTKEEETESWPEYRKLVIDKFSRLEDSVSKILTLQGCIATENEGIKKEIQALNKSHESLRTIQTDLEDSMAELSKAMATLAATVQNNQANCIRTTGHLDLFKQINDPERGVLYRISKVEEKVNFFGKLIWTSAIAVSSLVFEFLKRKIG